MNQESPVPITQPEWDRTLSLMVLASAAVHGVLLALVILIPHQFLHHPPALKSYTVDLIAPDQVGGSNIVAGGKGRVEGAPLAASAEPEPPKPPPRKAEEAKPPEPKPEPPKPVAEKIEPAPEPPKEVAKAEPKPEPPKPEPKANEQEAVVAEKPKKIEPPPAPTVAKAPPTPQAKPAASPKAVARAAPPPALVKPDIKAAETAKASKATAAARALDDRIAAAVKNVESQVGKRGGGSGAKVAEQPGGPIAVGPGEGAGGEVKGVQYLLYYNQMINRIKQVWAWAGGNRSLEASVRFNITETGDVVNVRITHPSGDPSYDASVERAVRGATPLSPPPEEYRKEFSDVELIFRPDDLKM